MQNKSIYRHFSTLKKIYSLPSNIPSDYKEGVFSGVRKLGIFNKVKSLL